MKRQNFINNFRAGQGLLEALLAIGIILVGLGAILTFTLKNISAAADSSQRIVAANLAREGIDVVRGIRDSNWLAASNSDLNRQWDHDFADANTVEEANLIPDANDQGAALKFTLPTSDSVPSIWQLFFLSSRDVADSEYNVYRHAQEYDWRQFPDTAPDINYVASGYKRMLLLDPICDNSGIISVIDGSVDCVAGQKVGIRVTVMVSWVSSGFFGGGQPRDLSLTEYIYNWR